MNQQLQLIDYLREENRVLRHASLRRGTRERKLAWVIGNPGHNPALSSG
jgi:hypothetical protein